MSFFGMGYSSAEIEKYKSDLKNNLNDSFWDPSGVIDKETALKNSSKLLIKQEKLKEKLNGSKRYLWAFFSLFFLGLAFFLISIDIVPLFIISFIIAVLIPIIRSISIKSMEKDLIKLSYAKKNGFLYNPDRNFSKYSPMLSKFPELFRKGNIKHNFEDQMWGTYDGKIPFYTSVFSYTNVTHDNKGNRHEHTYYDYCFFIKLAKPMNKRFMLVKEGIGSKIANLFTKKEINTESIEFNKFFAFKYEGKKVEEGSEIVKILSPAVQSSLVNLRKQFGGVEVLFTTDCVGFSFDRDLFRHFRSNLSKTGEIDPEVNEKVSGMIKTLIQLSYAVSKYND